MARGKVKRSRWYDPDTPKDPDSATRARDRLIKKQRRTRGNRQEMDVPHSQREIIDRPVSTMAEHLKPPRGAGTKKAVVSAAKGASKAGGMMKKAGSWIKRQGFVPTIR